MQIREGLGDWDGSEWLDSGISKYASSTFFSLLQLTQTLSSHVSDSFGVKLKSVFTFTNHC